MLKKYSFILKTFYENSKLEKQFKYATKKNISYAIIIGSKEMEEQSCVIKNLVTGEQQTIFENELISFFKK
jgi:histidyl-tRNA synthetase